MSILRVLLPVVVLALVLVVPEVLHAQAAGAAPGRQMRHFWHVFIAYGIAWALVFGWGVAIARRIARVEERLKG